MREQAAVGAVVMNRVRSGAYPDSIHGVIYASGQFTPALNGKVNRVYESGKIKSSCVQAAEEAIAGTSNVGAATHFRRNNGRTVSSSATTYSTKGSAAEESKTAKIEENGDWKHPVSEKRYRVLFDIINRLLKGALYGVYSKQQHKKEGERLMSEAMIFWLILLIVAIVTEVITLGLTTIWFAGGAWQQFLWQCCMDLCGCRLYCFFWYPCYCCFSQDRLR